MNKLRKSKKGFTLIELIVVIVIIAILVAALTPAILGVIDRANKAADEADCRNVMMAGSVAGTGQSPPGIPIEADVKAEFTGVANVQKGTYWLQFDGAVCVGIYLPVASTRSKNAVSIGDVSSISVAAPAAVAGKVISVTFS